MPLLPLPRFFLHRAALGARWAAAAAVAIAGIAWPQLSAARDEPWGKRMVEVVEMPTEALVRLARFQEKKGEVAAAGLPPGGMAFADTQSYTGPEIDLPASGNPYTLVLKVTGVALNDGDAGSRWMAGWSIDGSARVNIVPEIVRKGVRAGQVVEMAGAAPPVSFKADRRLAPVAEFAAARNLRIDRVRIEVWSGMRASSPVEMVMAWAPLLTGVVFLALFFWWRRR
ncbi:hypothetical protein M4R22_11230 [Acidovorax sp. GBBC 3334]|uniref:hypothetical protein n=1 Tax=Acidovorax sp. GBBC 3334 TaxID=2940496 RepID=UPI002303ADAE|nr:hypothetical protein [Acidovorax sp. GBBC 3334]MDA8455332.1 hypothetical protein [Acidovorax sp. GBBC 3334]